MQRYFSDNKNDNKLILSKDDFYHIKKVMRMKENDEVEVVYNHEVYLCNIKYINDDIIALVKEKQEIIVNNKVKVSLAIPILKENKMDLILQKATELGVHEIIPVIMKRSIIKVDGKEEKKLDRWRRICKEASEQSMRTDIPSISEIKTIYDLNNFEGAKILCSTNEKNYHIKNFLHNNIKYDKILVVMGPEGGFDSLEEKELIKMGFKAISLGKFIMRIETVPLFILSVINYEYME